MKRYAPLHFHDPCHKTVELSRTVAFLTFDDERSNAFGLEQCLGFFGVTKLTNALS